MYKPRKLNRLASFDYSSPSFYFITICTHQKKCYFGSIDNDLFISNTAGNIALLEWQNMKNRYNYIAEHAFIIMPNHIHAIMEIQRSLNKRTISQIIANYKSSVSRIIHQTSLIDFKWQRSFHDHIIRNEKSFKFIKQYIKENPANWHKDCFYQD